MSLPIAYKPGLRQERGLPTLLKLLHDAAYDPSVNDRIVQADSRDLEKLVRKYVPNASPALMEALSESARAAKRWVETRRAASGGGDDPAAREAYTQNMRKVMDFLFAEMHAEAYSVIW